MIIYTYLNITTGFGQFVSVSGATDDNNNTNVDSSTFYNTRSTVISCNEEICLYDYNGNALTNYNLVTVAFGVVDLGLFGWRGIV